MQILDPATIADLIGADWPVTAIEEGQWFDTTPDLLAWARRVYPDAEGRVTGCRSLALA